MTSGCPARKAATAIPLECDAPSQRQVLSARPARKAACGVEIPRARRASSTRSTADSAPIPRQRHVAVTVSISTRSASSGRRHLERTLVDGALEGVVDHVVTPRARHAAAPAHVEHSRCGLFGDSNNTSGCDRDRRVQARQGLRRSPVGNDTESRETSVSRWRYPRTPRAQTTASPLRQRHQQRDEAATGAKRSARSAPSAAAIFARRMTSDCLERVEKVTDPLRLRADESAPRKRKCVSKIGWSGFDVTECPSTLGSRR